MSPSPLLAWAIPVAFLMITLSYVPLLKRTQWFSGTKDRVWYLIGIFSVWIAVGLDGLYHVLGSLELINVPRGLHIAIVPLLLIGVTVRLWKWQNFKKEVKDGYM